MWYTYLYTTHTYICVEHRYYALLKYFNYFQAQQTKKAKLFCRFYNLKYANQNSFNSLIGSLKNIISVKNLILQLPTNATYVQGLILMSTDFFQMLLEISKMFKTLLCLELLDNSEMKRSIQSLAVYTHLKGKIEGK